MIICDREVSDAAIKNARDMAAFYRSRGYQPLPSRTDQKRPYLVTFKEFWESPAPANLFDLNPTSNIQVVCGRRWKLLVVDLDGEESQKLWPTLGRCPLTWVAHSGGDGQHWWFSLPENYPTPLPTGFLWKGEDKHSGIERICDHGLIVAPPSIHPKNGNHYKFLARHAPHNLPMPARCPEWLLRMPLLNLRPSPAPLTPRRQPVRQIGTRVPKHFDLHDVLAAIPDKVALAETWGLRVASRNPSQKGWVACHAIDRQDVKPSAAINAESGMYVDRGSGTRLKFFELAATIGGYTDWQSAVQLLGEYHLRGN